MVTNGVFLPSSLSLPCGNPSPRATCQTNLHQLTWQLFILNLGLLLTRLGHIRDATKDIVPVWAKDIGLAGSKITAAMDFHSDRFSGDVLALYVRNDGGGGEQAGGTQLVASFWKIYNELLHTDPAVLETMAEANWPFELKQRYVCMYVGVPMYITSLSLPFLPHPCSPFPPPPFPLHPALPPPSPPRFCPM